MKNQLKKEYIDQGGNKHTKKLIVYQIISEYEHDFEAEGDAITKRRLWYILKPLFMKAVMPVKKFKGRYVRVDAINNRDYNKYYNELSEEGIIDDTYITDSSREMGAGELLPHIIIAPEKATIATTAQNLAEKLGCSYYISSGQSSIYGAKKLLEMIDDTGIVSKYPGINPMVLTLTDHDDSGDSISKNIGEHFGVVAEKVLLTPDQIPEDKLEDYFDIRKDGTKAYELDILNIHQLEEVFLDAVPTIARSIILDAHKNLKYENVRISEITRAIYADKKMNRIIKALQKLRDMEFKKRDELYEKYGEMYDKADPTSVEYFGLHNIVEDSIEHSTEEWRTA